MKKHVAIFSLEMIHKIFEGKKIIEGRFSQKKIPPFGQISVGDIVYMKQAGQDIKGQFLVKKLIFFENIDASDWAFIRKCFTISAISSVEMDDKNSLNNQYPRFGTLIFIDRVEQFITPPIKIKKRDGRGWMVLD